jgi:hypothetical protein
MIAQSDCALYVFNENRIRDVHSVCIYLTGNHVFFFSSDIWCRMALLRVLGILGRGDATPDPASDL